MKEKGWSFLRRKSCGREKSIAKYAEHSAFSPPTRDKEVDHLCNFLWVSLVLPTVTHIRLDEEGVLYSNQFLVKLTRPN